MEYYQRQIENQIKKLQKGFPVISVTGPRQSGKTTFLQHHFKNYKYFNLENPQTRGLIEADIQGFFALNKSKIIIDEIQRLPELLSYIQVLVDSENQMGSVIISGSQNLLISEQVSQSLAGRAAYQTILPFSLLELKNNGLLTRNVFEQIIFGFYPALYTRDVTSSDYYNQYTATYVERDARLIKNISSLSKFRNLLVLLSGRVGQVLNVASLATDVGISPNTAEDWISILEASYIVFRLKPYYKNIGKRVIKSAKIYFYDSGLLCNLLNISSVTELSSHYAIGNIFENFAVSEFVKYINNSSKSASIYFFRDSHGNEIDLIIDTGNSTIPIEIKSSSTFRNEFFNGVNYWRENVDDKSEGYVVYSGEDNQKVKNNTLVSWKSLEKIFKQIS